METKPGSAKPVHPKVMALATKNTLLPKNIFDWRLWSWLLWNMKRAFSVLAFLCSALALQADYFPLQQSDPSKPTDLMLIYQGGVQRPQWTVRRFAPYVTYVDPKTGKEQWLYDGFLFIEFQDGRGHTYEEHSNLKPANKEQWAWLLRRNFAKNDGVPNLEKAVEAAVARIGRPVRRRQVVLTLPTPQPAQTDWGDLDGRPLDFHKKADRLAACNWYLDAALRQWKELAPKELDLAGFYWVAEQVPSPGEGLPDMARLAHARGKEFFWIPYWQPKSRLADWKSFGFDEAWLQPNYFFHPTLSTRRLQDACDFARAHGMGLEMEFDSRMITDPPVFEPRFHAYLDAFARNDVQERAAMAWYEGGGALYSLASSKNPKYRGDYDELARFVLKRQRAADATRLK
ncbi:MAG: DUF4855 domain-containing protein [Limisphaerales bacterium]